ncbi:MAG: hypothetical protein JO033_27330 [Acidobacteriaceae bacterium]|nr:hypothetical protein [Acidobacteriaceae bacterium]
MKAASYAKAPKQTVDHQLGATKRANKQLIGVDVFLQWNERNPTEFGKQLEKFNGDGVRLKSLSNRGVKVYPESFEETFCTDHWRAGFFAEQESGTLTHQQVVNLLDRMQKAGLDFIKIENLYTFDGQKGFVASQGE